MFEYPKKFHNWKATETQLSFLEFLKNFNYEQVTNKLVTVKISFESEKYARVIIRKDTRKIDFPVSYNFFMFEKSLINAISLFSNE